MTSLRFRVQLDSRTRRRLFATLLCLNAAFAATTTAFIALWGRLDTLGLPARRFVRYVLVQGHLGTENVVAAWYSSMLLLAVAAVGALAFQVDRREGEGPLRYGWLGFAAVFLLLSIDELGSLHERIGMLPIVSDQAIGWVYLLALPIVAVGAFVAVFAWIHVRRVRGAFWFIGVGLILFLLDPVLEDIEMGIVHSADAGNAARALHDVLLIVEEAILELTGILCFGAGAVLYIRRQGGETLDGEVTRRDARLAAWIAAVVLVAGVLASLAVDAALPAGDSGIPANWFPAAAWMVVAVTLAVSTDRSATGTWLAVGALALSAVFGAGLYVYWGWLASRARWVAPVFGVATAALTLEAVLNSYRFIRSPRSSITSPALRRARPKPS